jgi:hypothetical protein
MSSKYVSDRIKRSSTIKLMEVAEDYFKVYGSTGKIYTITKTEPETCDCFDYTKNKKPCKHIYFILRLNLEPRNEECSICFDDLDNLPFVCRQCKHGFHQNCISEMEKISKKKNCPMCRSEL